MDEAIGVDEHDPKQEITLHDVLADFRGEDADTAAVRKLDWDTVLDWPNDRRQAVVTAMASGYFRDQSSFLLSPPGLGGGSAATNIRLM